MVDTCIDRDQMDGSITEREMHCYYMAVQSFPYDIVREAVAIALSEAGKLDELATPTHLKYVAHSIQLYREAFATDDDGTGGVCS